EMTQPAYRSMLCGVGLLASALVLLELLTFRLCAAAIGQPVAVFAGLAMPAVSGLAAAALGERGGDLSSNALARRAAHLAIVGGAFVVLGAIGMTWASQEVARANGYGNWHHVVVALASFLLGPMFLSAAAAV